MPYLVASLVLVRVSLYVRFLVCCAAVFTLSLAEGLLAMSVPSKGQFCRKCGFCLIKRGFLIKCNRQLEWDMSYKRCLRHWFTQIYTCFIQFYLIRANLRNLRLEIESIIHPFYAKQFIPKGSQTPAFCAPAGSPAPAHSAETTALTSGRKSEILSPKSSAGCLTA